MYKIRKAAIIGGAVIGGLCSVAGKLSNIKFLDELGDAIIDSTILTGSIAGEIAGGAVDLAIGKVRRNDGMKRRGIRDLKSGGNKVFRNWVDNFYVLADNSGEIIRGVKERDGRKVLNGTKTLGKVAAIGFITVGAIKVENPHRQNTP